MFVFACSSCKSRLEAPAEAAGTTMACPYCQHPATVPLTVETPSVAPTAITTPEQAYGGMKPNPDAGDALAKDDRQTDPSVNLNVAKPPKRGMRTWMLLLLLVGGAGFFLVAAIALVFAVVIPAVQASRQAEARKLTVANMRKIGLACYAYEEKLDPHLFPSPRMNQKLAPATTGLSWRVTILPYLDEHDLFNEFDLARDWNHPRNQPLWEKRPAAYECPWLPPANNTLTPFQVFTGPDTLFPDAQFGVKLDSITDGTANTILFAQGAIPVVWTKSADMAIQAHQPLPVPGDRFLVVMADATVRMIDRRRIHDDVLRLLINPKDGRTPQLGTEDIER